MTSSIRSLIHLHTLAIFLLAFSSGCGWVDGPPTPAGHAERRPPDREVQRRTDDHDEKVFEVAALLTDLGSEPATGGGRGTGSVPAARKDRFGGPLPEHAVARLQAARLREPRPLGRRGSVGVWGVALSPDGKRLLSAGYESPVRVWDPATGDELPPLVHPIPVARKLAFSPDGSKILAAAIRQPTRIHDAKDGRLVIELEDSRETHHPVFTPDGKAVIAENRNGEVCTWDATKGDIRSRFSLGDTNIRSLTFSPDRKTLALGCRDGTVRYLDPSTGKERGRLHAHEQLTDGIDYSPDGKTLATRGDSSLCLWEVATGKRIARIAKVYGQGNLSFTPDGKRILVSENGGVCLRDARTARELARTKYIHSGSYSLEVTPDGKTVFWADQHSAIRMARIVGDRLLGVEPERLLALDLCFSQDGKEVITVGDDIVRFWDASEGRELRRLSGHSNTLNRLALSPDGERLALAGACGAIRSMNAATGKDDWQVPSAGGCSALAFAPDGRRLAIADGKAIRLLDAGGGKEQARCVGHSDRVSGLAFLGESKALVSVGEDHAVILWDLRTAKERARLPRQGSKLSCVAASPDGKAVATGAWNGQVRLWAIEGDKPRALPSPGDHDDNVSAVAFSPDGKLFASAGWDGKVRVWDRAGSRRLHVFAGHDDEVASLAFSPTGKHLASGGRDHTVLIWKLAER